MKRGGWVILMYSLICFSAPEDVFSGASNVASFIPKETSDGWVLRGAPQFFAKDTLFEHINGQADLFLQYGFERSVFAVYQKRNSSRERIDLDIYDMGDVVHAFGIFSRFRQDDHSAGIGLDSYLDDRYALFYKGTYFVVLQSTESSRSSLKQLAKMIESRIVDSSPPPKEIGYFPKSRLKPNSIEYYPQGLMGRQFLKRGFKATYLVSGVTNPETEGGANNPDSNLFLAVFADPEEAERALKTFKEDLLKKGGASPAFRTQPGFETVKGEDAYQGKLIVVGKGRYLAGAAGFESEQDAESLLAELIKHLE